MKPKGLLIAVVLLAVLGGRSGGRIRSRPPPPRTPTDTSPKILTISGRPVPGNPNQEAGGETVDLKRENGKWRITEPKPLPADQDAVASHGLHRYPS